MKINKGYNIPDSLEIKQSPLHGLGVFATKFIPKETKLCICHYYDYSKKPVKHLRNPLVGFFNYSVDKNANLPIVKKDFKYGVGYVTELVTTKDIQKGEEVLLRYTWYDPTKPDTEKNKHYIPLPDCVTVNKVNDVYILQATKDIEENYNFGFSHSYYNKTGAYEPNPVGGYLTESETPNCELIKKDGELHLKTIQPIKKGEDITVSYDI